MRASALLFLLALPAAAPAQLALGGVGVPPPDERLFGHLPYADAGTPALVAAPPGFALGQPCRVRPAVAAALDRLLAAATADGLAGSLRGVSCYRSPGHQRSVFCRAGRRCDAAGRARMVAPPGYSEHQTGYAIDFAARPAPGCRDVAPCIAETPAGRWLLAHATAFGFELSFPAGNAQGVGWEPWHWRWVGVDGEDTDAAAARRIFAAARARFAAVPAVPPIAVRVAEQPPVPVVVPEPPPPPATEPPRRRRHGLFGGR